MTHLITHIEFSKANPQKNNSFGKIYAHESCSKKISSSIYSSHFKALLPIIRSECQLKGFCSLPYSILASKSGLSTHQLKRTLREARKEQMIYSYYHKEMKNRKGTFTDIILPEFLQDFHDYKISNRWFIQANELALEHPNKINSNINKKKNLKEEIKEYLPKSTSAPCSKSIITLSKEFSHKDTKKPTRTSQKIERNPEEEIKKAFENDTKLQSEAIHFYREYVIKYKLAKTNPVGYVLTIVRKGDHLKAQEKYDNKFNPKPKPIKEKQKIHYEKAVKYLEPIEKILKQKPNVQIIDYEDKIAFKFHDFHTDIYFEQVIDLSNPDSVMKGTRKFLNTGQLLTFEDKNYLKGVSQYVYI